MMMMKLSSAQSPLNNEMINMTHVLARLSPPKRAGWRVFSGHPEIDGIASLNF